MGYVQMTIADWMEMKESLKKDLIGVQESFVRIGYTLRRIEEQKLYEQDGYKSIAEFAKAEYDLSPSTVSRFIAINEKYSVDGYSEQLRPEFARLGSSKLSEMLSLPDSDLQMIQPETPRENIRELKQFNKSTPTTGEADDIRELVRKFLADNMEMVKELRAADITEKLEQGNIKELIEIINPGGNRSYRKGLYFLMMYENRITIKKYGSVPQDMTWEEFLQIASGEMPEETEPKEEPKLAEQEEQVDEEQTSEEQFFEAEMVNPESIETVKMNETSRNDDLKDNDLESDEEMSESVEQESIDQEHPEQKKTSGPEPTLESEQTAKLERTAEPEQSKEAERAAESELILNHDPDPRLEQEPETPENPMVDGAEKAAENEEYAPAHKSAETRQNQGFEAPEKADTEVVEKPFGSRKKYLNSLSVEDAANYLTMEYIRKQLTTSVLESRIETELWLREAVDENGKPYYDN